MTQTNTQAHQTFNNCYFINLLEVCFIYYNRCMNSNNVDVLAEIKVLLTVFIITFV